MFYMNLLRISRNRIFWILALVIVIPACREKSGEKEKPFDPGIYKESLIKANKQMSKSENDLIDDFTRRYGWDMKITGTGLRYMIYQNGNGPQPMKGDGVTINYSVMLLNGDSCYSSKLDGTRQFQLGTGMAEVGLEEGILLLHLGGKVKFILPSHLAFGLLGDQNKIPPKATLVYDVELTDIRKK
jgi:FKBP-type peptidyl-prolyl cis-trans isomerase